MEISLASRCCVRSGSPVSQSQGALERVDVAPAPLFTQQEQVLTTLVEEWAGMTTDDKKRLLTGIFDSITPSADQMRLEACEDWKPYLVAASPTPCGSRNR